MEKTSKIAFATSLLKVRKKCRALIRGSTIGVAFSTWIYQEMQVLLMPQNADYQSRSQFWLSRKDRRELSAYVHDLSLKIFGNADGALVENFRPFKCQGHKFCVGLFCLTSSKCSLYTGFVYFALFWIPSIGRAYFKANLAIYMILIKRQANGAR